MTIYMNSINNSVGSAVSSDTSNSFEVALFGSKAIDQLQTRLTMIEGELEQLFRFEDQMSGAITTGIAPEGLAGYRQNLAYFDKSLADISRQLIVLKDAFTDIENFGWANYNPAKGKFVNNMRKAMNEVMSLTNAMAIFPNVLRRSGGGTFVPRYLPEVFRNISGIENYFRSRGY